MNIDPGELDKRIVFKRKKRTSDGGGGFESTNKQVCKVWAHLRPLSGGEKQEFDQINAKTKYFVVIRYRNDIDESCWIEWSGKQLAITNVNNRGPRELYLIMNAEMGSAK